MRGTTLLGVALALLAPAACKQTIFIDQTGGEGGVVSPDSGLLPNCTGTPIDPTQVYSLEVVVAMDRSTGMTNAKFGDTTALAAARDTIDQYAALNQNVVRFGYVEFPGNSFLCSSATAGCCPSSLAPPSQTIDGFDIALRSCDVYPPTSSCPVSSQRATTAALKSCAPSPMQPGQMARTKRFVLLLTNGQPDCDLGTETPCNEARNAANDLLTTYGVQTFVVAPNVSDMDTVNCLRPIAANGGGSANFSAVFNQADLSTTIDGITHYVAQYACHLDVTPAQIRNPDSGTVLLLWKGQVVPYNPNGYPNGWGLATNQNSSRIDLYGMWCDRLIAGGPGDFTLMTGCEPTHR